MLWEEGGNEIETDAPKSQTRGDELSEFNRTFDTALIYPISYKFQEDISIKHQVNFNQSIFEGGIEKLFYLENYNTKLGEAGANFFEYGKSS